MSETYGHGKKLMSDDRDPVADDCGHAHPLLDRVHCQRLKGHPGQHGSYVDAPSADVMIHWERREQPAG